MPSVVQQPTKLKLLRLGCKFMDELLFWRQFDNPTRKRGIAVGSSLTCTGYHRVARARSGVNPWASAPVSLSKPPINVILC